ncbi:MAG: hypothetical protein PVF48_11910, partial [Syntrophobacterales bacterium]
MTRIMSRWLAHVITFATLLFFVSSPASAAISNSWPGPEGGTIQALAIDPASNTTLYAGTEF